MEDMNLRKKLLKIQCELKAPKNQYNDFGNFKYRSTEDILEALKPLLLENDCNILIEDNIVNLGNRYYVEATVKFYDDTGCVATKALAREADSKPKMDDSQVTGSTSSYARKYALSAMFLIDDVKDADDPRNSRYKNNTAKNEPTANQKRMLIKQCEELGADINLLLEKFNVKGKMTLTQYGKILRELKDIEEGRCNLQEKSDS